MVLEAYLQNSRTYYLCYCPGFMQKSVPISSRAYCILRKQPIASGGHFAKYWEGGGGGEIFNMYAFGVKYNAWYIKFIV